MKRIAVMLVAIVMLMGCAGWQAATPDERRLEALVWFNDNLEMYLDRYEQADPATQTKWDVKIKPWFLRANTALDLWAVGGEANWMEVKRQLLIAFVEHGLLEVE